MSEIMQADGNEGQKQTQQYQQNNVFRGSSPQSGSSHQSPKEKPAQGTPPPPASLPKGLASTEKKGRSRSIGHYIIGKNIGEGTFGKVKLGTHILTGEKVAIKILEKKKIVEEADVQRVTREIDILKRIRHPNIIQLFEIIETPKQLFLITEYASGGELFDYIVKKQKLKELEASKFFQQIICGVQYLHELGIVHRDLKPENLLLDHQSQIKLVDFGLSNRYKQGETLTTACGSPCYAAPEMVGGKPYHGSRVDVWSCGVILFAMVAGYLPFEDKDTSQLYKKIVNGDFTVPKTASPECSDLMHKIMCTDPERRINTQQIREHPFFLLSRPVCRNQGLIIGKNEIPIEPSMLSHLEQFGFKANYATECLNNNKHNQVTTIYYLLHKRYEREGKLPSCFKVESTPLKTESSKQESANRRDIEVSESPVKKNRRGHDERPVSAGSNQWEKQIVNLKTYKQHSDEQAKSNSSLGDLMRNVDFSGLKQIPDADSDDQIGVGISPSKIQKKGKKDRQQIYVAEETKVQNYMDRSDDESSSAADNDRNKEKTRALLRNFELHKIFQDITKTGARSKSLEGGGHRPADMKKRYQTQEAGKELMNKTHAVAQQRQDESRLVKKPHSRHRRQKNGHELFAEERPAKVEKYSQESREQRQENPRRDQNDRRRRAKTQGRPHGHHPPRERFRKEPRQRRRGSSQSVTFSDSSQDPVSRRHNSRYSKRKHARDQTESDYDSQSEVVLCENCKTPTNATNVPTAPRIGPGRHRPSINKHNKHRTGGGEQHRSKKHASGTPNESATPNSLNATNLVYSPEQDKDPNVNRWQKNNIRMQHSSNVNHNNSRLNATGEYGAPQNISHNIETRQSTSSHNHTQQHFSNANNTSCNSTGSYVRRATNISRQRASNRVNGQHQTNPLQQPESNNSFEEATRQHYLSGNHLLAYPSSQQTGQPSHMNTQMISANGSLLHTGQPPQSHVHHMHHPSVNIHNSHVMFPNPPPDAANMTMPGQPSGASRQVQSSHGASHSHQFSTAPSSGNNPLLTQAVTAQILAQTQYGPQMYQTQQQHHPSQSVWSPPNSIGAWNSQSRIVLPEQTFIGPDGRLYATPQDNRIAQFMGGGCAPPLVVLNSTTALPSHQPYQNSMGSSAPRKTYLLKQQLEKDQKLSNHRRTNQQMFYSAERPETSNEWTNHLSRAQQTEQKNMTLTECNWIGRQHYSTSGAYMTNQLHQQANSIQYATVKKIRQSISNYRKKLLISKVDSDQMVLDSSEPTSQPQHKRIPTRSATFQRKQKQTRAGRFNSGQTADITDSNQLFANQ